MSTKKIGKFIAEKRREKSYTQAQLAEKLGVTSKTISRWENGNYMPDLSMLLPLCEILEIQVEELLQGEAQAGRKSRKELEQEYYETWMEKKKKNLLQNVATIVGIVVGCLFLIWLALAVGVNYTKPNAENIVAHVMGYKLEKVHMIWAALASGPIAIGFFIFAGYEYFTEKRMRQLPGKAIGKVTGLVRSHLFRNETYGEVPGGVLIGWGVAQGEQYWGGAGTLKMRIPPWFPCIKYEVEGKEIQKIAGEGTWKDSWEIGQTIMVFYDPKKPSICMIEDDSSYKNKRILDIIIGSVLLLFCIVTVILAITMK